MKDNGKQTEDAVTSEEVNSKQIQCYYRNFQMTLIYVKKFTDTSFGALINMTIDDMTIR